MSVSIPPEPPTHRAWAWAVYPAAFVGGMLTAFHPTILSGFQKIQTDPGDPVLNHYFLEHSWRWASDRDYPAAFWSPPFFAPTKYVLTYSENLIGTAPLYWGLRLVAGEVDAFQWWTLLLAAANFVAMVTVLRWFGVSPALAALGGFLFAFGLPRQNQLCHHQLLPQLFAPFALWHFWRLVRAPERRHWLLLLVLTAWQLLASIHLGWFLLFALAVWLALIVLFDRDVPSRLWRFVRDRRWFITVTLAVWAAGLGLFFRNYYIGNEGHRRHYTECLFFMPTPSSWLACPAHSLWGERLAPGGQEHMAECRLGAGLGIPLLLVAALVAGRRSRRDAVRRTQAILCLSTVATCLVLIVLTMKFPGERSLWEPFFRFVPGANSMRVVGRVNLTVLPLVLVGGLVGLQALIESRVHGPRARSLFAAVILFFGAGEQVRTEAEWFDPNTVYPAARDLAHDLTDADIAYVRLEPRIVNGGHVHEITAMWAGLYAGMPVINGYSGRKPTGYELQLEQTPGGPLDVVRYLGDRWEGRMLIVGPGRHKHSFDVVPGNDPTTRLRSADGEPGH